MDSDMQAWQHVQELEQQWLLENEGKEVCMYCFNPRNEKLNCCGENHFEEVKNERS